MSGFTVQKGRFCERRMFRKKQKTILCQIYYTSFDKGRNKISRTKFNFALHIKANCYWQSCLVKNVPSSEVNETPTNDQNQSRNSVTNVIFTPNNNKSDFNSVNSIVMPFDDGNHHILINSKYFNINEINAIKAKENHFGILNLSIAS